MADATSKAGAHPVEAWDRGYGACRARTGSARDGGRPDAGFTLLELMIVMTIMLTAFMALSQSIGMSMKLSEDNREMALASDGIRGAMERIHGDVCFATLYHRYNGDPLDDPALTNPGLEPECQFPAPGNTFAVIGLQAQVGDLDGVVGEIVFPDVDFGGALELSEEVAGRDLNMDGDDVDLDTSGDYRILPVVIRVQWTGPGGERSLEAHTLITDR